MSTTTSKAPAKRHPIEVRRYLPGQTPYGNESIGKITGDFGKYEVVETVKRGLKTEQVGNFSPVFCNYDGNPRCLVHSAKGDISDPFRADESYLAELFIVVPPVFQIGDRVELACQTMRNRCTSMHNGIVVNYRGKHDPKNPRVRWASGWGVTSKAHELRLMTDAEKASLPTPQLCDIDR